MCIAPVKIKDTTGVSVYQYLTVPCGKCHECRANRSAAWAFRLEQEDKIHPVSRFVTLTYDDANLMVDEDFVPHLHKPDLQKFFKRLRFNTKKTIKYYACGEYGTTTLRPHYHAIIFGVTDDDVLASWKNGHIHFDPVEPATIRYVTNYLCKSSTLDLTGRVPEFSVMSKGLGKTYLTPQMIKWHEENLANYVVNKGGNKLALPRYYKDRIFDENQRRKFGIDYANEKLAQDLAQEKNLGFAELEYRKTAAVYQSIQSADYLTKNRNKL